MGISASAMVQASSAPTTRGPRMLAKVSSQMTSGRGNDAGGWTADARDQFGEITDRRDGNRDIADPVAEPVDVVGLEARKRAEEVARVGVRAARLRVELAELREHEAERRHADGGDHPAEDGDAADLREIDRQQEHSRADHVAGHEHRGLRQRHLARRAGSLRCPALRLQALDVMSRRRGSRRRACRARSPGSACPSAHSARR